MTEDIEYACGGPELLARCGPLWEKLKIHHAQHSPFFAQTMRRGQWVQRRDSFLAKAVDGGALRVDLAQCAGVAIGYCIATIDADRVGEIESIYVDSTYRRKGIGRALIEAPCGWFDAEGLRHRKVGVVAGNEAAIPFYQRFGFVPSATVLRHRDSFS
ncbi:MAG: GNAT family N-acetyltransferase [Candidatus Latescibacteria bacterium]|nr:GNAT family N-acetyltransferase [Candidatus Latescibacterota bacterium]